MRRFRPGWVPTLAVVFVAATCVRLGFWQLSRYAERSAIAERRASQHALPELDRVAPPWEDLDYRRVRLTGVFTGGTVATGGIPFSRNGYAAIGVFAVDGGPRVLVNRGWIPADTWTSHTEPPIGRTTVEGVLLPIPEDGDLSVRPVPDGRWPLEREQFFGVFSRGTRIPWAALAAQEGVTTPVVVVVGPELEDLEQRKTSSLPAGGYTTYLKVLHHLEYAAQWFGFAVLAVGLWAFYGWRRGRG
ncbi:MAG: SURF1 family protein [Alphaproteobacteria bacterium]|nr:SURF1 family protein [Alphaproteobacteria bacterium]MCB9693371.1 SURF1 family protein [Alphaproteobacteria bacterium]